MAKGLFLSLPLTGHVNPSLGLVRELVARGDDIVYYATDPFADAVTQAGGQYRAYHDRGLLDLRRLPSMTDELTSFLTETTARVLRGNLEAFRLARPDYVISDSVAPWGQWTARILGVPAITSTTTMAINRHVMRYAFTHGVRPTSASRLLTKLRHVGRAWRIRRGLCRSYRVSGPGVMASIMGSSDLNILYTSRYFQPVAETFDERFQFVGPILHRQESTPFDWDWVRTPNLVYISLGTLFNANAGFYRACFEAFAGEPIQVIVSTGPNVSAADLPVPPSNTWLATHVPQLAVLQRARVFVTHGGMNSASESLSFGVPMLVVPQMGEQAMVGRRIEQLGAGLYLAKEAVTPSRLRDLVRRLVTENEFRAQAERVRASFADAGGAARAADAIGAFRSRKGALVAPSR